MDSSYETRKIDDVLVLIADGQADFVGETFAQDSIIELPAEAVAVSLQFEESHKSLFGSARLKKVDNKVYADIILFRGLINQHFQLPHARQFVMMKPAVQGKVLERDGKILKRIEITGIGLVFQNTDERIPAIGV